MPDTALPNPAASLHSAGYRVLLRIFQHPISHNLSWREALALVKVIGTVVQAHDGQTVVTLGDESLTLAPVREKDLTPDDVMALRHLLTRAGWAPGAVLP